MVDRLDMSLDEILASRRGREPGGARTASSRPRAAASGASSGSAGGRLQLSRTIARRRRGDGPSGRTERRPRDAAAGTDHGDAAAAGGRPGQAPGSPELVAQVAALRETPGELVGFPAEAREARGEPLSPDPSLFPGTCASVPRVCGAPTLGVSTRR